MDEVRKKLAAVLRILLEVQEEKLPVEVEADVISAEAAVYDAVMKLTRIADEEH